MRRIHECFLGIEEMYHQQALTLLQWLAYARSSPTLGELVEAAVIDLVEEYIFSQEPSTLDIDAETDTDFDDNPNFHFLQAAFLIVVTQYWTGSERARRRVSKVRFDRVIEVNSCIRDGRIVFQR